MTSQKYKLLSNILICVLLTIACSITANAASPDGASAQGGNITDVSVHENRPTDVWNGIAGRILFKSPSLPNSTKAGGGDINTSVFNITSACSNPTSVTGFLFFSNSTASPTDLARGNLTTLNKFINATEDNATATFSTLTSFTIGTTFTLVPTTYTYVNNSAQSTKFKEGYFNDMNKNFVFAVEVNLNTSGYNNSFFDFQAILPTKKGIQTTYFLTTSLTITCPTTPTPTPTPGGGGGGGGGGGSGGGCHWKCSTWSSCSGLFQTRICLLAGFCPGVPMPPETRVCSEAPILEEIIPPDVIIRHLREMNPLNLIIPAPELVAIKPVIGTFVAEVFKMPVILMNPNIFSVEVLSARLAAPSVYQIFLPLHLNPKLYGDYLGAVPIARLSREMHWSNLIEVTERILPNEQKTVTVAARVPMISPRAVDATIEILSGETVISTKEISILLDTKPFRVLADKQRNTVDVMVLIDNRNQPGRQGQVELNFNKDKKTQFSELYEVYVPADSVAIYGYKYRVSFEYTHVAGRYDQLESHENSWEESP